MSASQPKGAVVYSLALHAAVIGGILVGIPWPERPRVAVPTAPIEGMIIDQAAIAREQAAREETVRQERQQQQREERQRREADEQRRVEQQREAQRVANEQLAREQAAQKERDRVAAEKAAEARREREREEARAQAQRDKEAADKRAREQAERRRQQQAEAELQQQLALEAEQTAARAAGLYDQYLHAIQQRIKTKWQRPLSARPGIDCMVRVVQLPTGDVVSASVVSCNGDDAVRRSIENAVRDASPLPRAPTPAVFERNVEVRFQPEE